MDASSPTDPGQRKALGRGLAALIPQAAAAPSGAGLRSLPLERIHPNRDQPRKQFDEESLAELAASIKERGVLQPIVVRKAGDGYEIVAGERRWRAAARAGLQEIPVLVKDLTDADALQVALIENLQRDDLDPLEEAEAYSRLIREHAMTQEQTAQAVGKSRAAVANSLRLLKLPVPVLAMLADGGLTAGHARAIMTLDSDDKMARLANAAAERHLTVRDTERQARLLRSKPKSSAQAPRTPAEASVEERLQRALGTKVRLHHRQGRGRIEVFFHTLDQLDGLIDKLTR